MQIPKEIQKHLQTLTIPELIRTTPSHCELAFTWVYLDMEGKQRFGRNFRLYEEDALIHAKLIAWFLRDEGLARHLGIDLNKGFLLTGPVGCGKTSLMRLVGGLLPVGSRPDLVPCRALSFEVMKYGMEVLPRYMQGPAIFDDLGLESRVQYFGNTVEPMAEILLSRYERNAFSGCHLTTNLSSQEIEDRYGRRIRSRLKEMVNLVSFDREAVDKRGG